MRKEFAQYLYQLMKDNPNIWLVTGDLGYGLFDKIKEDFPDRFLNTGAAEQAMMDISVGLAMEGKIPFVYSITPFLLYRPLETLRTYINHESIPVIMIGSGRDSDYAHDGFSHYAGDDHEFLKPLTNIQSYWPESIEEMKKRVETAVIDRTKPTYINLKR